MNTGLIFSLLFFFNLATTADDTPKKIYCAVASNFLQPMQEIKKAFEKTYPIQLELSSASSGVLTAQIMNGAPFHLFISANMKYPLYLHQNKLTLKPPLEFIHGRVAFWSKEDPGLASISSHLNGNKVQTIAIADPDLAPYGAITKDWLSTQGLYELLKNKLIFAENIGKVNHYIFISTVDAAFSSNSAMYSEELMDNGSWQLLDTTATGTIPHGLAMLKTSEKEMQHVLLLYDFLQSGLAKDIFEKYGYVVSD